MPEEFDQGAGKYSMENPYVQPFPDEGMKSQAGKLYGSPGGKKKGKKRYGGSSHKKKDKGGTHGEMGY